MERADNQFSVSMITMAHVRDLLVFECWMTPVGLERWEPILLV